MDTTKSNNTLVFFISDNPHIDHISTVLSRLDSYKDVCITSDKEVFLEGYANIPLFYLKFCSVDIVFFTVESYLEHRDTFASEKTILALTSSEYMGNSIDPRNLSVKKIIEL